MVRPAAHSLRRPPRRADTLWDEPSLGIAAARYVLRQPWGSHTHPDIELNLVLSGGVEYLMGGARRRVPARRLVAFWSGLPHGLRSFDGPSDFIWVTVPVATALGWGLGAAGLRRLFAGELLESSDEAGIDLLQLPRWVTELRREDELRRIAALEIQARLRRLCAGAPAAPLPAAGAVHLLLEHLSTHYQEPLRVADAAEAAGLHPRRAMALVRAGCGIGIHQLLTRLRLAHAARLLAAGQDDVLGIALDAGFASPSRFYAAFRAAFACAPLDYRRRMRA